MSKKTKKSQAEPAIKPLETEFEQGGFRFKQICREGDLAIYQKTRVKNQWDSIDGDYECGYDVIVIKHHNGYELGGVFIPPAETYPGASLFGVYAWSAQHWQEAEEIWARIVAQRELSQAPVEEESTQPGEQSE